MTGFGTFALFGAVAITAPQAAPERPAQLGVTANVIRPADISTSTASPDVAVVTIANAPAVAVLPEAEMVNQADGNVRVAVPVRARSITITLTY